MNVRVRKKRGHALGMQTEECGVRVCLVWMSDADDEFGQTRCALCVPHIVIIFITL